MRLIADPIVTVFPHRTGRRDTARVGVGIDSRDQPVEGVVGVFRPRPPPVDHRREAIAIVILILHGDFVSSALGVGDAFHEAAAGVLVVRDVAVGIGDRFHQAFDGRRSSSIGVCVSCGEIVGFGRVAVIASQHLCHAEDVASVLIEIVPCMMLSVLVGDHLAELAVSPTLVSDRWLIDIKCPELLML
jgi:hypothetical protein